MGTACPLRAIPMQLVCPQNIARMDLIAYWGFAGAGCVQNVSGSLRAPVYLTPARRSRASLPPLHAWRGGEPSEARLGVR
ncbi:MAG: hypothetical protein KatS3mg051_0626 [Anaerolineae bacterium]|nr:MAG: hypothetical protein KatS3mg051_0626 [Anaerolineae bacterium]